MKKTHPAGISAILPIFCLLAILALPVGLRAGSLIDTGTSVPTPGSSDQSDLTPDGQTTAGNSYSNISGVEIGQSFTTGSNSGGYTLNYFVFEVGFNYAFSQNTLTLPASVYLGSGSGGTVLESDTGTLTESALGTQSALNNHFLEFTFATPITLLASTQYSVAFGQTSGGAIKYQGTTDSSTYTSGTAFETGDPGDGNTPGSGVKEFVFDAGLTAVTSPVPEPASTAALLLGGAGFLAFKRRRRR